VKWVPEVLVDYRQVHGEGADGICAQARESGSREEAARKYLLNKWRGHPDFKASEQLGKKAGALGRVRADEPEL
jgi:hypothetical protein